MLLSVYIGGEGCCYLLHVHIHTFLYKKLEIYRWAKLGRIYMYIGRGRLEIHTHIHTHNNRPYIYLYRAKVVIKSKKQPP